MCVLVCCRYRKNTPATTPSASTANLHKNKKPTAIATFDFGGDKSGDLRFQEGDTITLVKCEEADDWWVGEVNGKVGSFPKTYVEVPLSTQSCMRLRYDMRASMPTHCSCCVLLALFDLSRVTLEQKVKTLDSSANSRSSSKKELNIAVAMYDFEGVEPTDLSFQNGQIITLTMCDEEEDW